MQHRQPSDSPSDNPATIPAIAVNVVQLSLQPWRILCAVFFFCVFAELSFFLLDWHVNYGRLVEGRPIRHLLNTTREDGLASWFAATQMVLIALTFWLIYVTLRTRDISRWVLRGWFLLSLLISYVAFDDGTGFHERIGSTFRMAQQASAGAGGDLLKLYPSYPWQLVFLPAFIPAGLLMLVFLWRQFATRFSRLLLVASMVILAAAIGLDFVEGLDEGHVLNVNTLIANAPGVTEYADQRFHRGGYQMVRHFQKSLEETLEMFAMTLLWIALLNYWMGIATEIHVKWSRAEPRSDRPDRANAGDA